MAYRLRDDRLAAAVYVAARRSGVAGVSVKWEWSVAASALLLRNLQTQALADDMPPDCLDEPVRGSAITAPSIAVRLAGSSYTVVPAAAPA